jgi:hypothetical protein
MAAWLAAVILATFAPYASNPYQIFGQARNVWAQQRYPRYLTYTVTVRVTERGVDKAKHYHLAYDSLQGKIFVNPISDEERTAPPDPNGVTFHLLPRRQFKVLYDKQVGNPGDAVDPLGVPVISPTYSFGMSTGTQEGVTDQDALVQEIRNEFKDPTPPTTQREIIDSGGMKTIAIVSTFKHRYDIALDGIDTIDGHDCYHLSLKPAYRKEDLRLRELWVDTQTYQTRKLVSATNFTGSTAPWLVTFNDVNGALYIGSEIAMAPIRIGLHHYDQASVSFGDITATDQPPNNLSGWFITKQAIMTEPATPKPQQP